MCLGEELDTAVEYFDHISARCKVKNKFPSWWQKNSKQKVTKLFLEIPFVVSLLKKYGNIMEGDQMENESDVEQNESDNDYSCKMPRKKLNTSLDTMGISPVHLHGVAQNGRASTAKNKLDRAVEVLKTSWDAYVVSTDQLASSESVNVISETEQNASELDHLHSLMKEKLTTAMYSEKIQILTFVPDSWSHRYCAEHFNSRQISAFFVAANKMLR